MRRDRLDHELNEEIRAHLEMATRAGIERGLAPDEARAAALREFGNVPLIAQTTREMWPWLRLEQVFQDLRFGARILWHAPGLSAAAVVLIALVIGGNTTIYSMVNSLLVSPAPGVTAERLIVIKQLETGATLSDPFVSFPNYTDYARLSKTLAALAGWRDEPLTLTTDAGNYAVIGGMVTSNYFETLGIGLTHGRALQAGDEASHGGLVMVISDRLWHDRFGAAADVVGRGTIVNGMPVTIVGVAAPKFGGALRTPDEDVWLPIVAYYRAIGRPEVLTNRAQPAVLIAGRLASGASLSGARAELTTLLAQLHAAYPESFTTYSAQGGLVPIKNPRVRVSPYSSNALLPLADIAPRFLAVFSVITLVTLLIVSANVANLMLGRAVERQRDTAVRQSLGAPRTRLVRMFFAEGATLAVTAWVAACVFAWWTARGLLRLIEVRPGLLEDARPDWTFAAYAMLLALAATLAFSIGPGIRAWRLNALPFLKAGEHSVVSGRTRIASVLVVFQFAFSVLLVTSAGLAYRSMSMFDSDNVGFQSNSLLLVTVRAAGTRTSVSPQDSATDRDPAFARFERARERLAATSTVEAVTYARRVPGQYFAATVPVWRDNTTSAVQAFVRAVGPDYLRTLGLSAVAGRELTAEDRRGGRRTAVINRRLADELFAGGSPVGHTLKIGSQRAPVEIVGVAPDAQFDGPIYDHQPRFVLIAEQQLPGSAAIDLTFLIRHQGTVDAATPIVGRAISEVDASLPIVSISTMDTQLAEVTVFETFLMRLLVSFAAVSLLIAALGQYAVAMFNMRRRTREFGVRMALGASSPRLQSAVIREAFAIAVPGAVIGFALSAAVAVGLRSMLLGVTPVDPPTYIAVAALLMATSVAASIIPAWRTGRVNVIEALRQE
jgi:predicted permease